MKKYYDLTAILSTNAYWNIVLGERSNGKSYAIKKYCFDSYFKRNKEFYYLRRYTEDIKTNSVQNYFADFVDYLTKITGGAYNEIYVYQRKIYARNKDSKEKILIGHYGSISEYERLKSQQFPNVENIIFEEFITDRYYIDDTNEPNIAMNIVSTILRDRVGKVFLVGNLVSQICPYFTEWNLSFIRTMKEGEIVTVNLDGIKLAIERCLSLNRNNFFFGNAKKSISEGQWETKLYPRLTKPYKEYEIITQIGIDINNLKFVLELLYNEQTNAKVVFIRPYKFATLDRWISDKYNESNLISICFYTDRRVEKIIVDLINKKKIAYSDNLTATNFNQILNTII